MTTRASAVALTHPVEPSRAERLIRHGTFVVSTWVGARIAIEGIGLVVVGLFGVPAHSRTGWFGLFFNWDSGYFECIATHGYFGPPCAGGQTSERLAFFPAYPLAARGVAWVLGAGTVDGHGIVVAMWLVAALASLGSAALLYAMVLHQHGPATARYATALLLFGPYALFLVASYSESLFLLFALGAWLCCLRRRYVWCALLGAGASLTRISGCFLVVGLVVLYLCQTLGGDRRPFRWRELITVALSGAGAGAYVGWVWWRTGQPLGWLTAQSTGWNRHTEWPWVTFYHQGIHVVFETRRDWQVQAGLELLFAGLLVLAMMWFVRSRAWPGLTFVGLTAVAMMTSTTYLSLARNTLTLFPLTVLVAVLLVRRGRRRYAVAVFSGAVVLLCYNCVQFALGNWAD